ncbi:MAG TPA: DUF4097 family beta strand repeat-containing protein [Gemmatimonadales bacterium]|nr:DUF4097 family beta strand repeat-containing protein [Gemmatimonadales bacterium]
MLTGMVLGLLVAAAQTPQTDTTVTVERGTRLELSRLGGDVTIDTWDRGALRVRAEHSSVDRLEVRIAGGAVTLSTRGRRGRSVSVVDYHLTLPIWMDVAVTGTSGDVIIRGTQAAVRVETVEGDVTVEGGRGIVSLQSIEGEISLTGATGEIDLNTVDGDVRARDLEGRVVAESVDGDIALAGIRSGDVTATSVDGSIDYDGTIRSDGRYRLITHDGDVTVTVPERVNAVVSVATFSGTFEADFPVTLTEARRGKRFSFTLGAGGARVELESFDGNIRLIRR